MCQSQIKNFFKDQTIFLTGGTGFLGKVLVEKLLRICEVKKVYLLVRPKKGKNTQQRQVDYFNYPCFDRIRDQENVRDIVRFIDGDCEGHNLGLNKETEEMLTKEATIVIHAAANVKFDQSLRTAAYNNVRATIDMLELAKKMPLLKAFVYVSTVYSNCPHTEIAEKFYQPPMTSQQLFDILNGLDDEILDKITPKLIGKWPNTYVFTKSIAEDYIRRESENLPVAIIRPAIIISTVEEPMPGWIDNFYGVVGIVAGAALGALRSLNAKLQNTAQIVPCDYVVNSLLAAAWNIQSENHTIYNYVAPESNVFTWENLVRQIENCAWDYPTDKLIWYYNFKVRENPVWHQICIFFMHTVPAYIVDFIFICLNKKPIAVENYSRINKMLSLTSYFALRSWNFQSDNVDKLWTKMNSEDKKIFKFDMTDVDWATYSRDSVIGGRVYLLKDPLDTIPQGKKKMRVVQVAHYTLMLFLLFLLFKFVSWILNFIY